MCRQECMHLHAPACQISWLSRCSARGCCTRRNLYLCPSLVKPEPKGPKIMSICFQTTECLGFCRECRVQDVTVDGTPIDEQSKSKIAADQAAGAVSLLIKIGHKVGTYEMMHELLGIGPPMFACHAVCTVRTHMGCSSHCTCTTCSAACLQCYAVCCI